MLRVYRTLQLALLLSCSCLLPHSALSDKGTVRVERMMPPGGPESGPGPMGPPSPPERSRGPMNPPPPPPQRPRETPPPVEVNFTTSCPLQRAEYRHITCEEDGDFSEIQCRGKMCFCVDPTTGERLNTKRFPEREKPSVNCSAEANCPALVGCTRVCDGGFRKDREGCASCRCAPPPAPTRCNTVATLFAELGCHCTCVNVQSDTMSQGGPMTRMMDSCPSCNSRRCDTHPSGGAESCVVVDQCPEGSTLQSVGRKGDPRCVPDLEDSSDCNPAVEEESRPGPKPKGAGKRKTARDIEIAMTPCRSGSVCQQVGFMEYECMPENSQSPCVMARASDSNIKCEPDGNFRPLQCNPVVEAPNNVSNTSSTTAQRRTRSTRSRTGRTGGQQMCRCVNPGNGTTVQGSELLLGERDKKPNCNRDCKVPSLHHHHHHHPHGPRRRTYRVRHGDYYFDSANCRSCQCTNGDIDSFCTPMGECSVLVPDNIANNCTLENGEVLLHSDTRQVGCDVCGCRDGRLECTHQNDCENTTDPCDLCQKQPPSPVCGPDGRNHLSRCTAVNCSGIPEVELMDGPCQSQDVCQEYPCDGTDVCVRRGAVTCMASSGCTPDQLRTCVNVSALNCPIEVSNETDSISDGGVGEDAVCGSDDKTYSSLCALLQTSTNVNVSHSGPCEDPDCQGGQVCGSDGVTYPNSCALESMSTTRVDYPGACATGGSAEEVCVTVLTQERCVVNSGNCGNLVFPQDGCCPICGGSLSVVLDRRALSDVATTNPEIQTMDAFSLRMMDDEVFAGIEGKCTVEAGQTNTNNLQFILTATDDRYSDFCFRKSEEIAERVNTGDLPSDGSQPAPVDVAPLPQVYEFAMAAVAAQRVESATPTQFAVTTEENGTKGLAIYLSVVIVSITAAALAV